VSEDSFEVGLSFGGVPERLSIPFAAVKGFYDPSVEFGLQFEHIAATATEAGAKPDSPAAPAAKKNGGEPANSPPTQLKARRTTPAVPAPPAPANPETAVSESPSEKPPTEPADKSPGGGEVVRLDRFRKK